MKRGGQSLTHDSSLSWEGGQVDKQEADSKPEPSAV